MPRAPRRLLTGGLLVAMLAAMSGEARAEPNVALGRFDEAVPDLTAALDAETRLWVKGHGIWSSARLPT